MGSEIQKTVTASFLIVIAFVAVFIVLGSRGGGVSAQATGGRYVGHTQTSTQGTSILWVVDSQTGSVQGYTVEGIVTGTGQPAGVFASPLRVANRPQ